MVKQEFQSCLLDLDLRLFLSRLLKRVKEEILLGEGKKSSL